MYHRSSRLDEEVIAPWLGSWSDLVGIVVLDEPGTAVLRRLKRELRRVGPLRLLDVLAFRLYYRLGQSRRDRAWESRAIAELSGRYPDVSADVPRLASASPNSDDVHSFIRAVEPAIVLARCKTLIDERVYSVPEYGTFVVHPGATPEYRNSHGCFWALARGEPDKVVASLVKIDAGVDTGPVYGYFSYEFDQCAESHVVIQKRLVLENLDTLARRFGEIERRAATPIDTTGRASSAWGQPWLTSHIRSRRRARCDRGVHALCYHDIVGENPDESGFTGRPPARYKIGWSEFGRHLDSIEAATKSPPVLASTLNRVGSRGSWMLTFDDGGASGVAVAEALASRGWPAHFLITTDRIGEPGFVDEADIRRLRELGHEVGSHSCSHPERMSHCSRGQLDREWRVSIETLSEIVGERVVTASVPGGYFSKDVARAAAGAGIEVLFTSEPESIPHEVDACLVIGRLPITVNTTARCAAELASGRRRALIRARATWGAKRCIKAISGPAYVHLRRGILSRQ
jgi:hypothetical protein